MAGNDFVQLSSVKLGRTLWCFVFSLTGLKRIVFRNHLQRASLLALLVPRSL